VQLQRYSPGDWAPNHDLCSTQPLTRSSCNPLPQDCIPLLCCGQLPLCYSAFLFFFVSPYAIPHT
jgi:hypothetical protein